MSKSSKLPALQFYPGDWKKDLGVQALGFHDRGVWFEMLLLMHDSDKRGKLILNNRPMTDEDIARVLGLDNQTFKQTLTNLLAKGVTERESEAGALISRRMLRDEKLREVRKKAGELGGNPALVKQKSTIVDNQTSNQTPTPSFSSSSSISSSISEKEKSKSIVEDSILDGSSSAHSEKELLAELVQAGWRYYLERTRKQADRYKFTPERQAMGRRGFESLFEFARGRRAPDVAGVSAKLFALAVDRLAASPFHLGRNDQGKQYLDWHQLFVGKGYPAPRKLLEVWLDDSRWP